VSESGAKTAGHHAAACIAGKLDRPDWSAIAASHTGQAWQADEKLSRKSQRNLKAA
jgi:hypothetical protein